MRSPSGPAWTGPPSTSSPGGLAEAETRGHAMVPARRTKRGPVLVATPTTLSGVCAALDELPAAPLLAGGTALMVEVNFGHRRPPSVVALRRVEELRGYQGLDDEGVLGAGVTWGEAEHDQGRRP